MLILQKCTNIFTEGCSRFKKFALLKHKKTNNHILAIPKEFPQIITISKLYADMAIKNLIKPENGFLQRSLQSKSLLENIGVLMPLDKHRENNDCLRFAGVLSDIVEEVVLYRLKSSPSYALILDETYCSSGDVGIPLPYAPLYFCMRGGKNAAEIRYQKKVT